MQHSQKMQNPKIAKKVNNAKKNIKNANNCKNWRKLFYNPQT